MIRPFTCVCLLLAGGSGLYLYQSKHRVQLLDHDIEAIVRATEAARARTGVLRAEWTLMNDPERLGQLAERFLSLKTTTPGQFTTMAELDNRLPAIRPPDAPPAQSTDADAEPIIAADIATPEPPKAEPAKVAAAHPAPVKPAVKPRAAQVAVQAPAPSPNAVAAYMPPAPVMASMLGRPAGYTPTPAAATPQITPVAAPMVGSSLGMARGITPLPYRTSE